MKFFRSLILSAVSLVFARASTQLPSLVLVGGGLEDENEKIWDTIISLGGGKGVARFGVISAASEDPCCGPDSSWIYYRDLLTHYGAAEVYYIPITVDTKDYGANSDEEVISNIKGCTGFFFGGGDQQRIIYSYYNDDERVPSPALVAIKETVAATGGVIAGTSAGTDCQTSKVMITCGDSYGGLVNGTSVFWRTVELPDETQLTAYGPGGISMFQYGLLDTHFANRGRMGRMAELLVETQSLPSGHNLAFGIDENTALVVTGDQYSRVGSVIGERGVLVFDVSTGSVEGEPSLMHVGGIHGVQLSRLSSGDSISLSTMQVTLAPFKQPLNGREKDSPPETSDNIFQEYTFQFDRIALSLFQSSYNSTFGYTDSTSEAGVIQVAIGKDWSEAFKGLKPTLHQREEKMRKVESDKLAQGYDGIDPATGLYAYSYINMWMSITPVVSVFAPRK